MERNKNRLILILGLLLTVMLDFGLGPNGVQADDVDVYMTTVKNTALVVADDSGSMSFPVYDGSIDFSNFMKWMRDPNGDGDTSDALAYDKEGDGRCAHWWNKHTLQAERYDEMSGVVTGTTTDDCGGGYVDDIDRYDWIKFSAVDFGSDGMTKVRARTRRLGEDGGKIEFWIDDPSTGTRVGTITVGESASSSWHTRSATLTSKVTGVH
ncbi:MAG: carbohydrate-binding protein, partial [Syntrophobacterales bacterium]